MSTSGSWENLPALSASQTSDPIVATTTIELVDEERRRSAPALVQAPDVTNSLYNIFEPRTANNIPSRAAARVASVASYCCRFCQMGDEREFLISPCKCKGSLAYIHYSCLTRWLNQSGRNSCELCLFRYNTVETRRYSLCQSLRIWVRHPRNRPHIVTIFLISGLLTLFVMGIVLMVVLGMHHFLAEGKKLGIAPYWISGTVSLFVALVLVVYMLTLYLLFRDQLGPWYRWWHRCINVRIVVDPRTVRVASTQPQLSTNRRKGNGTSQSSSGSSVALENVTNVTRYSAPETNTT